MNQLLKWSIENSQTVSDDPSSTTDPKAVRPSGRPLNAEALNSLFGGPTDADLMKDSMAAVLSPDVSLENKMIAFDNFEQLIENLDNANNMDNLGLWTPLVSLLDSEASDIRRYACWCAGTAVQNNVKSQERLLTMGAIPKIINLALNDSEEAVRRKAIYALSSEVRNFQLGLDEAVKALPRSVAPEGAVSAGNMDAVDHIMEALRAQSARKAA